MRPFSLLAVAVFALVAGAAAARLLALAARTRKAPELLLGLSLLLPLAGLATRSEVAAPFIWSGAGFGLCTAILFVLSFFPPTAYLRRVARRAAGEATG